MSENVTLYGFVGIHPYVAYTPGGTKVLVFSLGSRMGRQAKYKQIVLQGALAEQYQTQLSAGQRVKVTGKIKTREGTLFPYLWVQEIQILLILFLCHIFLQKFHVQTHVLWQL